MNSEVGAGDRIRTGDINLGKVALYQLSYSRLSTFPFSQAIVPVVNFNAIVMPKPQSGNFVFRLGNFLKGIEIYFSKVLAIPPIHVC